MVTYHINEYGFCIFHDGVLIKTIPVDKYAGIIVDLSKVLALRPPPLIIAPKPLPTPEGQQ